MTDKLKRIIQVFRDSDKPHELPLEIPLKEGEEGNLQTLEIMAEIVRQDRKSKDLRRWLLTEVIGNSDVAAYDDDELLQRVFDYAQKKIIYRNDPVAVERIADAWSTIFGLNDEPEGDCGIKSTFLATCLAILGKRCCFVVLRDDPRWNNFNHVYVGLIIGTKPDGKIDYIPLDPTPTDSEIGWEHSAINRATFEIF